MQILGLYNYWVVIVLMMAGLYIMIARYNLIKKIIGLGVFQTSIFYMYITMGSAYSYRHCGWRCHNRSSAGTDCSYL